MIATGSVDSSITQRLIPRKEKACRDPGRVCKLDCLLPAPPPHLVPQLILRVPWRVTHVASNFEGTAFGLGLEVATVRLRYSASIITRTL